MFKGAALPSVPDGGSVLQQKFSRVEQAPEDALHPLGRGARLLEVLQAGPALGLAESPVGQHAAKEAEEFGLHLVYGTITELVRRLLR